MARFPLVSASYKNHHFSLLLYRLSHSIICRIEHLFDAGMWVWIIVVLARQILGHISLVDLWKYKDLHQFIADFNQSEDPCAALSLSSSERPPPIATKRVSRRLPQQHESSSSARSSAITTVADRHHTAPVRFQQHELAGATRLMSKRQKNHKSVEGCHAIPPGNIKKMCSFVSCEFSPEGLAVALKAEKCSTELVELTNEVQHHMKVNIAERRQRILTDQYMQRAAFPGFATSEDLFFSSEFWCDKPTRRMYFDRYQITWSTEHVQVVLCPLFGTKQCFHLQMVKDYKMPLYEDPADWSAATKEWREHCSLDRSINFTISIAYQLN
jgi:hypothetical protein